MDKESIYELQKIDSNCNDCIFMQRDTVKYQKSLEDHKKWQEDYHNVCKKKVIDKAKWYKDTYYDLEQWDKLLTESEKMKFQFNRNEAMINYGTCTKLNKPVSFIPNTCQPETQDCFKHRRSEENEKQ